MGFSDVEEITLYRAISGILHLGNLTFEVDQNNSEACQFTESGAQYHQMVSELFGLDPHFFRSALLYKAVKSGKRTSVVYSNYTPIVAAENRNALSKELYNRCFSWIVSKVNSVLNVSAGLSNGGMIGILDIFGFEIFKKVSIFSFAILSYSLSKQLSVAGRTLSSNYVSIWPTKRCSSILMSIYSNTKWKYTNQKES